MTLSRAGFLCMEAGGKVGGFKDAILISCPSESTMTLLSAGFI